MQDRIEPPILISRLLTFVFAAALVVLAVLTITLMRMFPLNRPEVFFLTTRNPSNLEVYVNELPPNDENMDIYKRSFIREYIKARNEVIPNAKVMERKWNASDGWVHKWSGGDVFADFTQTALWSEIMNDTPDFDFSCAVEFKDRAVKRYTADGDTYTVDFAWFCTDSYGQTDKKDYTIKIKLVTDDTQKLKWADRLDNPLGIRVTEYTIESGDSDPLNTLGPVDE